MIVHHYSMRIAEAYEDENMAKMRRSLSSWRDYLIATVRERKEEAELFASSVLACVEDTAKSSDRAVQCIQVLFWTVSCVLPAL